jgi:hypothetical protein
VRRAILIFIAASAAACGVARDAGALTIELDYSYDTSGFFADPARREAMSYAASFYAAFADALALIAPGAGDTWTVYFNNPGNLGDGLVAEQDLRIAADTLRVFVGGSAIGEGVLGFATTGTITDISGSDAFIDAVTTRGQSNANGAGATDYGVWGGAISFNSDATWHFGLTTEGLDAHEHDFLTTAVHELGHILGFGLADSWFTYLFGDEFTGQASMRAYGGPVPADIAHWAEGVYSDVGGIPQETLMDPTTPAGVRELLTRLDYAGLRDIGWETAAVPVSGAAWLFASALATAVSLRAHRRTFIATRGRL